MSIDDEFDSTNVMVTKINQERKLRRASEDALIDLQTGFTKNVYKMQAMELCNENLSKEINSLKRSNESLNDQLQKRETENNFLKVRSSTGSDISSTLDEHEPPELVRELQKELCEVKASYTTVEKAFNQYREDINQEQEVYDELSKDMDELKEKNKQIKNDRDACKMELDALSMLYITKSI